MIVNKNGGKYFGATSSFRPRGFNIAGAIAHLAPAVPTPMTTGCSLQDVVSQSLVLNKIAYAAQSF